MFEHLISGVLPIVVKTLSSIPSRRLITDGIFFSSRKSFVLILCDQNVSFFVNDFHFRFFNFIIKPTPQIDFPFIGLVYIIGPWGSLDGDDQGETIV